MVGEGNLVYAYILKNVIKSQGEFCFGRGEDCLKRDLHHKGKQRLA